MIEKRVGIFIYYEWLPISPSLLSVIRLLTERGYLVDVFHLYNDSFSAFKPETDRVSSIAIKSRKLKIFSLIEFFLTSLKFVLKHKYDFFIGVDQEGIIVSGILSKIRNVPSVYYSLEIVTREDVKREKGIRGLFLKLRKSLESYFLKRSKAMIAQDKYRAEILMRDNNINNGNFFFVPNSYYFVKQIECNSVDLKVPNDKKVVIYTGSVIEEMAIEDLVRGVSLWPKDAVLLLHTPYRTEYLNKIEGIVKENKMEDKVFISVKQLSFEDLCCLLQKAHIGISLYRPVNESFATGPSGKLSFYLSQGLPVIVSKVASAMDLISKYNCGLYVDTVERVGQAVKTILNDYSRFSANTRTCYENELEFSKHFSKVLDYMEK